MKLILINQFAKIIIEANPGQYNKQELVLSLKESLDAKKNGEECCVCGSSIWAAGSALSGSNMCFACLTGETDDCHDYEIY